jgi:hypothetical protein
MELVIGISRSTAGAVALTDMRKLFYANYRNETTHSAQSGVAGFQVHGKSNKIHHLHL